MTGQNMGGDFAAIGGDCFRFDRVETPDADRHKLLRKHRLAMSITTHDDTTINVELSYMDAKHIMCVLSAFMIKDE
jgi:hypothetical protein